MILYDLTALQSQGKVKYHGGGLYAKIILLSMLEQSIDFCVFWDSQRYIENGILEKIVAKRIRIFDLAKNSFEEITKLIDNPVVFSILPKEYMFIVPTIGTVHDCREIELENDIWEYKYRISTKRCIIKLTKSIFSSYFRKRNISRFRKFITNPNFIPTTITKYTEDRIRYWIKDIPNLPIFMTPFSDDNHNAEYIPYDNNKYILLVSGDRWLKNNLRVIVALDQLFSAGELSEFKVKITGIENLNYYNTTIKNKKRFDCLGYVDSEEINELYKYAYCFIFPSLYEGFGIPPLEAFQYGTPVIASKLSSIPEVCEDAALYINPFSIKDIMEKILYMLQKRVYEEYSNKAIDRFNTLISDNMKSIDAYIDFVISTEKKIYG